MAIISSFDSKTIDELQELSKLSGNEKTIISDGIETKKVSLDSIVGYAASKISGSSNINTRSIPNTSNVNNGTGIVFIPEGEEIPVSERKPGYFYLEETRQTSIRKNVNIPVSVSVNANLGLKRV